MVYKNNVLSNTLNLSELMGCKNHIDTFLVKLTNEIFNLLSRIGIQISSWLIQ